MDGMLESRSVSGTPPVCPNSDYLAEKLQQRRANIARPKRARHTDIGPLTRLNTDDDIFLNEAEEESRNERARLANSISGFPGAHMRSGSRSSATAAGRRSTLGVRGMEERMDRLTKDNFALKMEVDQRRRYTAKLQEQVDSMTGQLERLDRLQEEHTELWRINDALVKELEKRDRAVEEAIDTICELEDKVAELEERRSTSSTTRPSTAHADSGYAGTETHENPPKLSPPKLTRPPRTPIPERPSTAAASAAGGRLQHIANMQTPAPLRREPNILSLKKPSTQALRSVYLDNSQSLNGVKSFISLLKERESTVDEEDAELLKSPSLSVLSETSLVSAAGARDNHLTPERLAFENGHHDPEQTPYMRLQQDSINRVNQWIQDGHRSPQSPSLAHKVSASSEKTERDMMPASPSKRPGDEERFRSIADALSTAAALPPFEDVPQAVPYSEPSKVRRPRPTLPRQPRPTSFAGPIFREPEFPPTPDSASRRMLRGSRSTVADDRNLADGQITALAFSSAAVAPDPRMRLAPKQMRSSVELHKVYNGYSPRGNNEQAIVDDDYDDPTVLDHYRPSYADDTYSETVRDLSLEYDGFPDGNSIVLGTPSRFLKHGKPPITSHAPASPATNLLFDGNDVVADPRRPQSSSGFGSSIFSGKAPRKPSLSRAETSPSFVGHTMVGVGKLLRRMSASSSRRRLR